MMTHTHRRQCRMAAVGVLQIRTDREIERERSRRDDVSDGGARRSSEPVAAAAQLLADKLFR
ncbi:hypothetical protein HanRHA438_Chr08g0354321 [Helianthus annuus]|uniref:Uncharacterized protein n=1 Tax=Helianthus annuus TaxID=4232 RepID=A0A251U7R6_HELAN|nr:hypothetical protein HanXRQr2_Chr08g0342891 [Helianthus annuus]KAJ0547250.1 hypothetical protein HanIR_Chr08g0370081 [Helianthus annuus]KAJ0722707.1 hypothetical protein HanOQP8_Chr08g0289711 [Helianthus annuus]KAJ0898214.1 hypothetical protein HanRHA438_Chr08g0354321 [Helianthus annuus]